VKPDSAGVWEQRVDPLEKLVLLALADVPAELDSTDDRLEQTATFTGLSLGTTRNIARMLHRRGLVTDDLEPAITARAGP